MKKKELKAKIKRLERDIYLLIREPKSKEAVDARWLYEFNYERASITNEMLFGTDGKSRVNTILNNLREHNQ